jgi:hypothetical protein
MRVLFLGESDDGVSVSSHHARALSAAGVETVFDDPSAPADPAAPRPDAIHLVTYQQTSNTLLRQLVTSRMAGVQIVRYWTGRDLLWTQHHAPSQEMALTLNSLGAVQFCRSPEIAVVLKSMGIDARPLPVISTNISSTAQPRALPAAFTVLCYLPLRRREFHGGEIIDAMVDRLSSVRFLILGGGGRILADRSNVECLRDAGDSVRAIQRATVVVDARRDVGLSRLALEALCHGRHLISGYKLPHSLQACTVDEFVDAVRLLRQNPAFNLAGRSYIYDVHDYHQATKALRRELEDAIEPGRLNLVLEGGFRGAAAAWKNPQLLSRRCFELPDWSDVPENAVAMRALLRDRLAAEPCLTA